MSFWKKKKSPDLPELMKSASRKGTEKVYLVKTFDTRSGNLVHEGEDVTQSEIIQSLRATVKPQNAVNFDVTEQELSSSIEAWIKRLTDEGITKELVIGNFKQTYELSDIWIADNWM